MSGHIAWLLELDVQPGKENDFQSLMAEMVQATNADEPGTIAYEWSTSEDGKQCHIYERYADSAAVMAHLGNFGSKFAERFLAALKPVRFVVYGSPSEDVREALAGFGPVYMDSADGFVR